MRYILTLLTAYFILMVGTGLVRAADVTVEMLNKFEKEFMVYSKKIVRVDIGDTVFWKSINPGHNVEFIKGAVPEDVDKFKSKNKFRHRVQIYHSGNLCLLVYPS